MMLGSPTKIVAQNSSAEYRHALRIFAGGRVRRGSSQRPIRPGMPKWFGDSVETATPWTSSGRSPSVVVAVPPGDADDAARIRANLPKLIQLLTAQNYVVVVASFVLQAEFDDAAGGGIRVSD